VNLDPAAYDFDGLLALPVRGSSQVAAPGRGGWTPVARPASFDPLAHGDLLDGPTAARLAWLLGDAGEQLGYPRSSPSDRPRQQQLLDARWWLARQARRSRDAARSAARTFRQA
jgi:hypothetical protein